MPSVFDDNYNMPKIIPPPIYSEPTREWIESYRMELKNPIKKPCYCVWAWIALIAWFLFIAGLITYIILTK